MFQNPVDPAEMDDREEISEAESVEMVSELADTADGPGSADLRELSGLVQRFAAEPDSVVTADATRVAELFSSAVSWSARTCAPTTTVWGCASRSKFEPIGDTIGEPIGPDTDADTPTEAANAPEDVAGSQADPALRRVEVTRDAERVLFAWVDEHGLAQRSDEVVNVRGTWTSAATSECN